MALNESHSSDTELFTLRFLLHISFPTALEAPGGFEPPHKGFADLSLTTWVRRRNNCRLRFVNGQLSIDRYSSTIDNYAFSRTKKDPVAWWEFGATGQYHRGSDSDIQSA